MASRIIVILIAIWCVIQGSAYGILSILALLAHDCQISMRQSKLSYLMYIIFFRDRRCEAYDVDWNYVVDHPPSSQPHWPAITMVAFRTDILAWIYLSFSIMWIVTSLMLIVGCFMACLGKVTYYLLMMPWAIFCALTSILDVVAVGFFFYDLFNTLNTEALIRHLDIRFAPSTAAPMEINANILPMPAVILLIVTSRGFIFWCLNILSIPIVLSNAKYILFGPKRKPESVDDQDYRYPKKQMHGNILENHFPPTVERSRYSDPSQFHQYQYDNMSYQQDKYDLSRTIGRRYMEPLKNDSIDEPDNKHVKRIIVSQSSSPEEKSSKKSSWSEDSGKTASTVHLTQANQTSKDDLDMDKQYDWNGMPMDIVVKIERPHFRCPNTNKSSLLKKLSDSSYVKPEVYDDDDHHHHHHSSVQYTGEELRGQLPWSYFGAPTDVIKPKKSFNELRDDEDIPPVPVPDYTMNISRKDPRHSQKMERNIGDRKSLPAKKFINPQRGSTSTYDQNSQWSGPEYRY